MFVKGNLTEWIKHEILFFQLNTSVDPEGWNRGKLTLKSSTEAKP